MKWHKAMSEASKTSVNHSRAPLATEDLQGGIGRSAVGNVFTKGIAKGFVASEIMHARGIPASPGALADDIRRAANQIVEFERTGEVPLHPTEQGAQAHLQNRAVNERFLNPDEMPKPHPFAHRIK